MDLDKILDDCMALENTISLLIESNADKKSEWNLIQTRIQENADAELTELIAREDELFSCVESYRTKKEELDSVIKQYTEINEKLSELVLIAQNNDDENQDLNNEDSDLSMFISKHKELFQNIKLEYFSLMGSINFLEESLTKDVQQIQELLENTKNSVTNMEKNEQIIRMLHQEHKFAEQQFDLIINQLPWEPLTDEYFGEVRQSRDYRIRNLVDALQLQAQEIVDLNESLDSCKKDKLDLLEKLAIALNNFAKKREDALLMNR